MNSIAIVIINWKQPELTQKTLDSLFKIKHPNFNYQVFLLNSQLSEQEEKKLKTHFTKQKNLHFFSTKKNLGFSGGNNYLLKKIPLSKFKYTLLLNNDVVVDPNFLNALYQTAENNPQYSILGPKIYFYPGYEYHQDRYQKKDLGKVIWSFGGIIDWQNIYASNKHIDQVDKGQFEKIETNIDFITGCALFTKSEILQKLNFFDHRYYLYLEDVDLCQRAKKLGFKLAGIPDSKIWHLNSGSSGAASNLHDYFMTRNRILFASKFASLKVKILIIKQSLSQLLNSPSKWQKQGIIDAFKGSWYQGSWKN